LGKTDTVNSVSGYGDSSGISYANYNLTITVEPRKTLRDTNVTLNLIFKNNEDNELTVEYIKFDLSPKFKVLMSFSGNKPDKNFFDRVDNKICIHRFNILKNETKLFSYRIYVPKSIRVNKIGMITNLDISIERHRISNTNEHNFSDIDIQNNLPTINFANIQFPPDQIKPYDNNTLLFIGNASNLIDLKTDISANDIEDGNELNSSGIVRDQDGTDILEKHLASLNILELNLKDLKPSKLYSLWIKVKDKNNNISESIANITYDGKFYNNIMIPDEHFIENTALTLSFYISAIFVIIIYILFRYDRFQKCRRSLLSLSSGLIILIYAVLIILIYAVLFNLGPIFYFNNWLYLNSIPILDLVIYIIILTMTLYFTEACFPSENEDISRFSLPIVALIMFGILAFFMYIIPSIPNLSFSISAYYSTMAIVFGTIFSLIVLLSGQFPRNIITFDNRSPHEGFSYHKKIRYFVAMYGTALGLSLFGLVGGTNLKLNILITGSFEEIIINIIPVVLFESTLLLIAPSIISLYNLLKVISFRGKIIIKSEPPGARISSLIKEGSEVKLDNLDLFTPCTLILQSGKYELKLEHKDHRIFPLIDISITDGQEKEYFVDKSVTFIYNK
jgi:hypothetical protein